MRSYLVFTLLSFVFLCPVSFAASGPLPDVQSYFDLNGAAHATKSKELMANGYRIISLSSYGTPPNNKYAAVWVKRRGNRQVMISDVSYKTYRTWLRWWKLMGYVPRFVSAVGPGGSGARFAAVMEKGFGGKVKHWCNVAKPGDVHWANDTSYVVKDFSTYGKPNDRRYCVVAYENMGNEMETIFYSIKNSSDFSAIYRAQLKKPFWRPVHLFVGDDQRITPQFANNWVGEWAVKTDLTVEQLEAEIKSYQRKGRLYPIHIDGTGTGKNARFAVIFAETDVPESRKWTVTGKEGDRKMTNQLDSIMKTWMQLNGVRQAQLAAARDGEIFIERGYTWAESNRAIVEPDDVFLLASLSKMFTHAAIHNLIQAGKLDNSTLVYNLLGFNNPKDPRALKTTISHLLEHSTGYNRSISKDTAFEFRAAAKYLYDSKRPANLHDMIEYQLTKPLDFEPGANVSYSNYGMMLLGYVVSNITQQPFLTFLRENILEGLNVSIYETAAEKHGSDRIVQESRYVGLDAAHPESLEMVPSVFGGDGAIKEECDATFSLAASASTVAKFIGKHAVWGTGGRDTPRARQGTLPGARSFAMSSPSGIDWALLINTRDFVSPVGGEDEGDRLAIKILKPFFDKPNACLPWMRKFCAGA
ncbi:penicillin-binding protein [Colletotrichum eremochloae]|nr:penicillin-binding protein [Colletotrichum eremochloae]